MLQFVCTWWGAHLLHVLGGRRQLPEKRANPVRREGLARTTGKEHFI